MAGFHINLSTTHCYLHVHCTCNPKTCCQNNSSVQKPYFQFHSILFDHIILIYIRFLVLSLVIIFMSIHSVKLHTCMSTKSSVHIHLQFQNWSFYLAKWFRDCTMNLKRYSRDFMALFRIFWFVSIALST